jgi:O-antigen/teichoic acid export membrane protein
LAASTLLIFFIYLIIGLFLKNHLIIASSGVIIFLSLNKFRFLAYRVLNKPILSEIPDLILKPIFLISIVIVIVKLGINVNSVLLFIFLSVTLISLLIIFKIKSNIFKNVFNYKVRLKKGIILYSFPFFLFSLLNVFRENIEIIFSPMYIEFSEVSILKIYLQFAMIISYSLMAVNVSQSVKISKALKLNQPHIIEKILLKGMIFSLSIASLIIIFYGLFFKNILIIFYDFEEYIDLLPFGFFVLSQLFYVFVGPFGQILLLSGYTKIIIIGNILSMLIFILLLALLGSNYNLLGIAVSTLMSNIFLHSYYYLCSKKILKINHPIYSLNGLIIFKKKSK